MSSNEIIQKNPNFPSLVLFLSFAHTTTTTTTRERIRVKDIPFTPYRFLSPTFYTYIHQKSGIGFHTKKHLPSFHFHPLETCAQAEVWCSACVWFDEMMMIREIKKKPYPTHLCINQSYCALKMT